MPIRRLCRALAVSLFLAGTTSACRTSGGVDGRYYSTSSGAFAFELKGGRVLTEQGEVNPLLVSYTVRGDSVFILPPGVDPSQALSLGIKPGGILDWGPLGSVQKK